MKDFKKILILLALIANIILFVSAVAFASITTVTIEKTAYDKKISVLIENLNTSALLQVKNEEGVLLLEEKVKSAIKFAKIVNVSNLPEGDYQLIVSMERKEVVQPFALTDKELVLNTFARKEFFAPAFKVKDGMVDVMLLNNSLTNVNVSIVDSNGDPMFEEALKNVLKVERRYSLATASRGKYMVRVETPYKAYYQEVVVK